MSAESGCGIAVMAKASIPGRAKTRLVPPLTFAEAADFNTAVLKDVVANIAAAAHQGAGMNRRVRLEIWINNGHPVELGAQQLQ